jgi:hypothetical protein
MFGPRDYVIARPRGGELLSAQILHEELRFGDGSRARIPPADERCTGAKNGLVGPEPWRSLPGRNQDHLPSIKMETFGGGQESADLRSIPACEKDRPASVRGSASEGSHPRVILCLKGRWRLWRAGESMKDDGEARMLRARVGCEFPREFEKLRVLLHLVHIEDGGDNGVARASRTSVRFFTGRNDRIVRAASSPYAGCSRSTLARANADPARAFGYGSRRESCFGGGRFARTCAKRRERQHAGAPMHPSSPRKAAENFASCSLRPEERCFRLL